MNKYIAYLLLLFILCFGALYFGRASGRQKAYRTISQQVGMALQSVMPQIRDTSETVFIPSPITLDTVFATDHSWAATISADRIRTVIATGDVIPARSVNNAIIKRQSFRWPYEKTAELLRSADITLINLETPLLSGCAPTISGMSFCGDARNVEGLAFAGIDVAGFANNHMGNAGLSGIDETVRHLKNAGIAYTGTPDQPIVKDIRGISFVFLSYNDIGSKENGLAWAEDDLIRRDIQNARSRGDVVVVSFHWGVEYQRQPDERQIFLAHLSVDSGADLVIGNHPHWIQPPEIYKGKLIMYAHGNFVFDQEWSEETKLGVVGRYTFFDRTLIDAEYIPIRIVDYGQPYLLGGSAREGVLLSVKNAAVVLSRK